MPPVSTSFIQAQPVKPPTFSNIAPEAHNGHSDGAHKVLGRAAILSSARFLPAANSAAAVPSTSSAPIAIGFASQTAKAANVPRTADPALTTSFTIATRLFRRRLSREPGMRARTVGQTIILCRLPGRKSGRVEKPAEVEENKSPPKSEHSAKGGPSAGRFFMKFRGPQALPNRPQKAMVCPTK
jgi:hypothetical protein